MPKILLLVLKETKQNQYLPYDNNLYEFRSRNRLWNTPHLGLLTVGTIVSKEFDIEYIDLNYEILKQYSYDYVFMSPSTSQAFSAYCLAGIFKKYGTKVVMGGPHITMLPNEAKQYADIIFIGESEDTLVEFLKNKNKKVYFSEIRPNMKKSPVPLYEYASKYPYSSIPIQLSRGCPHQCEFCLSSTIYGRKIRRKELHQACKELEVVKKNYKNPFIFFTDDNFFVDTNYTVELLHLLETLKISWYAFTDISIYKKPQIIRNLYQSGCRKLLIGFESLNQNNLELINKSKFKSSKLKEYQRAINIIQKEKIGIIGSFVLGLDYDNRNTFQKLYEFIYETALYGTNITISTPFPGTRLFQNLEALGEINYDWSLYDGFTLLNDISDMSKEEFLEEFHLLLKRINSRERLNRVLGFFKELI